MAEVRTDILEGYCNLYPQDPSCVPQPTPNGSQGDPRFRRFEMIEEIRRLVSSRRTPRLRSKRFLIAAEEYGRQGRLAFQIQSLNMAITASLKEGDFNEEAASQLVKLLHDNEFTEAELAVTKNLALLFEQQRQQLDNKHIHVLELRLEALQANREFTEADEVRERINRLRNSK